MRERKMKLGRFFKITIKALKEVFKVIPVIAALHYLTSIITAVITAVNAYIISIVFDNAYSVYSGNAPTGLFYRYIIIYLALYLTILLVNVLTGNISGYGFHMKGTNKFKIRLGEHVSKLSIIDFEKPDVLNLLQRANQTISGNKVTNLVSNISGILFGVLSLVGVLSVLASFSVWLIPVAIISCIPTMAVKIIRGEHFYQMQKKQIPQMRELNYFWSLFLSPIYIKEMRTIGFADYFSEKWEKTNIEVAEENWRFQKKDAFIMFVFDFFKIFCYMIGILASIYLTYKGVITAGQFGACIASFASMQVSMFRIVRLLSAYTGNCPFAEDYFKFLEIEPERWGENEYTGLSDKIELKDISFKYPNTEKYVLEDIDLTIQKGEKIAIIGENGSGKTTLAKIIIGLYPPENGTLLYDGNKIDKYDVKSFYNHFSIVLQNFTKYFLSLRENVGISYIPDLYDDVKIEKALERTEISEVTEKTGGLDGMMGREFGGAEFSGGQWQKLAISRGLFKDYDFIILDEPTSALDPIVETEIFKKFLEAMDDKTALIISHRVGFCRMADKIIVMKDGKIHEEGTHADLIEKRELYFDLFTSQQAWYL